MLSFAFPLCVIIIATVLLLINVHRRKVTSESPKCLIDTDNFSSENECTISAGVARDEHVHGQGTLLRALIALSRRGLCSRSCRFERTRTPGSVRGCRPEGTRPPSSDPGPPSSGPLPGESNHVPSSGTFFVQKTQSLKANQNRCFDL
jgi:hypothetical protein